MWYVILRRTLSEGLDNLITQMPFLSHHTESSVDLEVVEIGL